ncbi:MAG: Wzz/FepE/Etk N-terminal domain-containing protein [Oleiphilaceae bacterium]|nr:Wzz/FepE/Etk N-terminal domain-containing protein [Oleiphilaceae bacterium]
MTENSTQPVPAHDDEIDLVELFRALWAGKWWILASTMLAAVLAVFYALSLPDKYSASALVAPVSEGGSGGLSALASQYGGLASMAGVNIGGGDASKRQIALETLKSRRFLMDFIERHDLKVPLLASDGWDMERGEWRVDKTRYEAQTAQWLDPDTGENTLPPSDLKAMKVFSEMMSVSEDTKSGMVTISIESRSPQASQQWVDWLIRDLNEYLKRREMEDTRRNVAYLEEQLERTNIAGMRQVFFSLIEEQTKMLMLAELDPEYAFQVVDPPVVPEERSAPKRSLVVVLAVLLGGMLSTFGVLVAYAVRQRKTG